MSGRHAEWKYAEELTESEWIDIAGHTYTVVDVKNVMATTTVKLQESFSPVGPLTLHFPRRQKIEFTAPW